MNLAKVDPKCIVKQCSDVHIENVMLDMLEKLKIADKLVEEVLMLNSNVTEIGAGKMANMKEIAEQFKKGMYND